MREWIGDTLPNGAERAAFAEAVNHFAPRLRDFLSRSGAPDETVEEAVQSVLTELWRGRGAPDGPFGRAASERVFALASRRRDALLGAPAGARLDPATAFAPAARGDAPMPSLAAVEARLQRIQEQLRRARQRQGRPRAA